MNRRVRDNKKAGWTQGEAIAGVVFCVGVVLALLVMLGSSRPPVRVQQPSNEQLRHSIRNMYREYPPDPPGR